MDNSNLDLYYVSIVDSIDSGIVMVDTMNRISIWNKFMQKHSGITAQDLIGINIFEAFPYLPKSWLELKLQSVRLLKSYSFISWTQRPYLFKFKPQGQILGDNLEYMHQDSTFIPITNDETGETSVCITITDVTDIVVSNRNIEEMKDMTQTLVEIANYDSLTSIYNRGYIEKQITLEFNRAKRHESDCSVVMFDIDHFKTVNDKYGHLAGDEVLKDLSRIVPEHLRNTDLFGRFGGEEFIVLLVRASEEDTIVVSEKLRKAIETHVTRFETSDIQVTVSLGFVQYDPEIKDYLQMLHQADLPYTTPKTVAGIKQVSLRMVSVFLLVNKVLVGNVIKVK